MASEPLRHERWVTSAEFNPDSSLIVTASLDTTARIWDAATGEPIGEPLRHEHSVNGAEFSPDGARIVTVSENFSARVWDTATRKPLGNPLSHKAVISAGFSPRSSLIVTTSWDKTARLWDTATGQLRGEPLRHEGYVWSAKFNADGSRIVTVGADGIARLWDVPSGKRRGELLPFASRVGASEFSPDGSLILTNNTDGTVRIWDAISGKPLGEPLRHEEAVTDARFSPDGSRMVTASEDMTARVWQVSKLKHPLIPVPEWMRDRARALAGLEFNTEGEMQPIPMDARLATLLEPTLGENAWAVLARWAVQPAAARTLTPDSQFTYRQIAERERDLGSKESLESVLRCDPTVPLARLLLAGSLLREDAAKEPKERDTSLPQRAAFLRDYDLKRLPDDAALWERAVRALQEQKDNVRAHRALQRLEKLAPEKAAALRNDLAM